MPTRRLFVTGVVVLSLATVAQPSFGDEAVLTHLGRSLVVAIVAMSSWFVACLGVIAAYRRLRRRGLRSAPASTAHLTGFMMLFMGLASLAASTIERLPIAWW